MYGRSLWPAGVIFALSISPSQSSEIVGYNCHATFYQNEIHATVRPDSADLANILDASYVNNLLARVADTARDMCASRPPRLYANGQPMPQGGPAGLEIVIFTELGAPSLTAKQMARGQEFKIINNGYARKAAATAAATAAREAEERKKAEEARALDQRKRVALTDCASGPNFVGGPWFSSTYKVAARDETQRGGFFCVKTIEYLRACRHLGDSQIG